MVFLTRLLTGFWIKVALLLVVGLLLALSASAQLRVSGTITNAADGKPVPGTTVRIKGSKTGVIANNDGDFRIDVAYTDTLEFISLGFATKRLALGRSGLSQIIVQVKLDRASIQLGEVRVQEGRPADAQIKKALRNVRRPEPPANAVKRPPAPKPLFPVDSTAPKAPVATLENPASMLYDALSREGKERRKMEEIQRQDVLKKKMEQARRDRERYNRNFKDNRGYE